MEVTNLEQFRIDHACFNNQIKISKVIVYYDGLVKGYCVHDGQRYYFTEVEDENTDYFTQRTYALIIPPILPNVPIEEGRVIGWFLEGEGDYESWNKFKESNLSK